MNDFKKNNRFGGGKGGFGKRDFSSRPSFGDRPRDMYDAVCASCGKTCQVPFRPNGKKPVYCKDCFAANGGPAPREEGERSFAPRHEFKKDFKRDFQPRPAFKPEGGVNNGAIADLRKQIDALNAKVDKLVTLAMQASAPAAAPARAEKAEAKKPVAKKAAKKKK